MQHPRPPLDRTKPLPRGFGRAPITWHILGHLSAGVSVLWVFDSLKRIYLEMPWWSYVPSMLLFMLLWFMTAIFKNESSHFYEMDKLRAEGTLHTYVEECEQGDE